MSVRDARVDGPAPSQAGSSGGGSVGAEEGVSRPALVTAVDQEVASFSVAVTFIF